MIRVAVSLVALAIIVSNSKVTMYIHKGFMNTITHYSRSCGTPSSNGTENHNNVSQFHAISSIRSLIQLSFKCLKGVEYWCL